MLAAVDLGLALLNRVASAHHVARSAAVSFPAPVAVPLAGLDSVTPLSLLVEVEGRFRQDHWEAQIRRSALFRLGSFSASCHSAAGCPPMAVHPPGSHSLNS